MPDRSLAEIAHEIRGDWTSLSNSPAEEYVTAMSELRTLDQSYGLDTAVSVVAHFLGVCGTWRGPVARRVKDELRNMLERQERPVRR